MKFAVIVFPGSNCDSDMYYAIKDGLDMSVDYVWYTDRNLSKYDAIVLPGGFSYGDYLRSGAIARSAPIMEQVQEAACQGKLILGVCNGFQILLEARLLPGAMCRNSSLTFRCFFTELEVMNDNTPFTGDYHEGEIIRIPIAHGEGNYYCDADTLTELCEHNQIVLKYRENPNGSTHAIAGITNRDRNVLGMMPHPERAVESPLGSVDGLRLFTSMVRNWRKQNVIA